MADEFPIVTIETDRGTVPLRAIVDVDGLYLLAGDWAAEWPLHLLRENRAELRWGDRRTVLVPRLVSNEEERTRAINRFRRAAGESRFGEWFPQPGRLLRLSPPAAATGPADPRAPLDRWLEAEFDLSAQEYESRVRANPIEQFARTVSIELLQATFPRHGRLLEIGPGVGLETLPMLREGHRVTAVDISGRMLERLRERANVGGLGALLETVQLPAHELGSLPARPDVDGFAGAYSTFGALNTESDLRPVLRAVAERLPAGSRFVVGFFNRWGLMEVVTSLAEADRQRAFHRFHRVARVGSTRFGVDFYPRSPPEIVRAAAPAFRPVGIRGFPLVLPPADRVRKFRRWLDSSPRAARSDAWLGRRSLLAALADHVWITFERTEAAPSAG